MKRSETQEDRVEVQFCCSEALSPRSYFGDLNGSLYIFFVYLLVLCCRHQYFIYIFLWGCFGGLRFISSWPRLNNVERFFFFKKKSMHKCEVQNFACWHYLYFSSYVQFNTFILFPIFKKFSIIIHQKQKKIKCKIIM